MSYAPDTYTLVADIGGTNTRVALAEGSRILTDSIHRFANADHPGLESVLRDYVAMQGDVDCIGACVAAGWLYSLAAPNRRSASAPARPD